MLERGWPELIPSNGECPAGWRRHLTRMRPRIRQLVHDTIATTGIDAVPMAGIRHSIGRRARLIRALKIDLVIDVGANTGQFGEEIRAAGYGGRILSVEPLSAAFAQLSAGARRDGNWSVLNCAVGEIEGESTLHVAANSASSSLLEMLPAHEDAAPGTGYVGVEEVRVRRLESILSEHTGTAGRCYVKVDVQGSEMAVLRGAGPGPLRLAAIQLELSLARLYADAPMFAEVDDFVTALGYELAGVEPGLADQSSGRLLQLDGIYVHSDLLAGLPGGAPA